MWLSSPNQLLVIKEKQDIWAVSGLWTPEQRPWALQPQHQKPQPMFELNEAAHFQPVHVGLPLHVYWLIRIRITTNWVCGHLTAQRILLHFICIMSENKDPGLGWEILTLLMVSLASSPPLPSQGWSFYTKSCHRVYQHQTQSLICTLIPTNKFYGNFLSCESWSSHWRQGSVGHLKIPLKINPFLFCRSVSLGSSWMSPTAFRFFPPLNWRASQTHDVNPSIYYVYFALCLHNTLETSASDSPMCLLAGH